jgi:hypothetical protein
MSTVNTGGLTVPDDSDPVAQGAAAMRTIASKLGAVAAGTTTLSLPTANATNSTAVTFPAGRFTAAPVVTVNRSTGVGASNLPIWYWASGVSTSGFTLSGISAAIGGAATLTWMAVQAP